jgi:DNA-binding response OmpR family regulator
MGGTTLTFDAKQPAPACQWRVLVVEEDFTRLHLLMSVLSMCGAEAVPASADDAEATASRESVDAIFLNLNATRGSGIELVRRLRRTLPDVPVTSIGHGLHPDLHIAAIRYGVRSFLSLPFDAESVGATLRESIAAASDAA